MEKENDVLTGSGPIFKGTDGINELPEFLAALRLWFVSKSIEKDDKKVRELIGRLRGSAIDWFDGFSEANDINETTYEQVTTSLQDYYGCTVSKFYLWSQFIKHRQSGSLNEYNTKFRNQVKLFSENNRPDKEIQLLQYVHGLRAGTREYICRNNPETILEAQRLANLWELADEPTKSQETPRSTFDFKRGAGRNPKGSNENDSNRWKTRRLNGNQQHQGVTPRRNTAEPQLCFTCNKPGHYSRQCPEKSRFDRTTFLITPQSEYDEHLYNHENVLERHQQQKAQLPKTGNRKEIEIETNKRVKVKTILDTGAPTSFVHKNLVRRLELQCVPVPLYRFKGALPLHIGSAQKAAMVKFTYRRKRYNVQCYVTEDLTAQLIIGNPILEEFPELMSTENKEAINKEGLEIDQIEDNDIQDQYEGDTEIFTVQLEENECNRTDDTFRRLPESLQAKYRTTVRNDLPPREEHMGKVQHEINTLPDKPLPRLQPYRLTPKNELIVQNLVAELIEKGFIVPSKSPCSSPIVLVKKKDESFRLCVDYRQLNRATVKDPFPLPHIETLLGKIENAQWFSTIDLHSGYHQIQVKQTDQYKTAFVTPSGKYEYRVMPFGLVNAPSTFARYMADLFRGVPYVCVYLDDILTFSETEEEHWNHLDHVLGILKRERLIAKLKKCHFFEEKVEFLGYQLSYNAIRPIQEKCEAIAAYPTPKTIKEAQRFLGTINYYRKFIPRCSEKARSIIKFITQESKWGEAQNKSFAELKKALMQEPLLVPFKRDGIYRVTTDASKEGVGAVLEEIQEGKVEGVVAYFSKSLQGAQKNYPAGELELLGIIEALRHFKYLLHGKEFTLRTDHISLLACQGLKEPNRRIATWLNELSEFDVKLEYLSGKDNVVADAISRADYPDVMILDTVTSVEPNLWLEELKADPLGAAALRFLDIVDTVCVSDEDLSAYEKYRKKFRLSEQFRQKFSYLEDRLYYDQRLVVPMLRHREILETYHDHTLFGGHFGTNITFAKIANVYYWPTQYRTVDQYVRSCLQCQLMKAHRPRNQGLLKPLQIAEGRWRHLSMDFVTGLPKTIDGQDMILVVVDRFSKRAHFVACRETLTSQGVIDLLFRYVFGYHGFPHTIVSDRDTRFTSDLYQQLTKRLGIKLLFSSTNHPQTDGQTERCIQVLSRLMRTYTQAAATTWHTWLPHIEFVYNATYNTAIHASPFEVDLGYCPNEPLLDNTTQGNARDTPRTELTEQLQALTMRTKDYLIENQVTMETSKNEGRKDIRFKVGEWVLLHRDSHFTKTTHPKTAPIYLGPYQITKVVNDNAYELNIPNHPILHKVVNVQWLKKYIHRSNEYNKAVPTSSLEKILRGSEIMEVIGFDTLNKKYFCKMRDVDPTLTVEYAEHEFNSIPSSRRQELLDHFNQSLTIRTSQREEGEDVMKQ